MALRQQAGIKTTRIAQTAPIATIAQIAQVSAEIVYALLRARPFPLNAIGLHSYVPRL